MSEQVKIDEIFRTIQGETTHTGWPFAFVRLAGCNLRCRWCDTPAARSEGHAMSVAEVLDRVGAFGCRRVLVTGGEPLIQAGTVDLLARLCDAGFRTLLETNGSRDVGRVDPRVVRIVDVKCPSSGHADATCWDNLDRLAADDEVKFVVADADDYAYACDVISRYGLTERVAVTFTPVADELDPGELASWMLADGLDVRLGVQVHKVIWPGRTRGV